MYALFEGKKQIGSAFATEKEAWEAALIEGRVTDVPTTDEPGGYILPGEYHVEELRNSGEQGPESGIRNPGTSRRHR